jgi:hypothetical protein
MHTHRQTFGTHDTTQKHKTQHPKNLIHCTSQFFPIVTVADWELQHHRERVTPHTVNVGKDQDQNSK